MRVGSAHVGIEVDGREAEGMFKIDDAVSVDTTEYDLESPGTASQLPGIVLAVNEGPQLCYQVRVRLRLGAMVDLTVPADRVSNAESDQIVQPVRSHSFRLRQPAQD
jgi:hypothetical protein